MAVSVYMEKQAAEVLRLYNDTGADVAQGQLVVIQGRVAIAQEAVLSTAIGPFDVSDAALLQSSNLHATENTFATNNQAVYLTATGLLSDTSTTGYKRIGYLAPNGAKSGGVIKFYKSALAVTI